MGHYPLSYHESKIVFNYILKMIYQCSCHKWFFRYSHLMIIFLKKYILLYINGIATIIDKFSLLMFQNFTAHFHNIKVHKHILFRVYFTYFCAKVSFLFYKTRDSLFFVFFLNRWSNIEQETTIIPFLGQWALMNYC